MYYILGFWQRRRPPSLPLTSNCTQNSMLYMSTVIPTSYCTYFSAFNTFRSKCHAIWISIFHSIPPRTSFISLLKKSSLIKLVLSGVQCRAHTYFSRLRLRLRFAFAAIGDGMDDISASASSSSYSSSYSYSYSYSSSYSSTSISISISISDSDWSDRLHDADDADCGRNSSSSSSSSIYLLGPGLRFLLRIKHNTTDFFFFAEALSWSDFTSVE